jgi:hypothetical protein
MAMRQLAALPMGIAFGAPPEAVAIVKVRIMRPAAA